MSPLKHNSCRRKSHYLGFVLFFLFLACSEQPEVATLSEEKYSKDLSNIEEKGSEFYDHITNHALEDPLAGIPDEMRRKFAAMFDSLSALAKISPEAVLDHALNTGQVTRPIYDAILQYNSDVELFVQQNPDVETAIAWCLNREDAVKRRKDLSVLEKRAILIHQTIVRYYLRQTIETTPQLGDSSGRIESWQSVLCWANCAIKNITAFSQVGSKLGEYGTWLGAYAGLVYTIMNSESCNCDQARPCGAARAISSTDQCYSASTGTTFTAWGYGQTPWQFTWDFYREDISNPPVTRVTNNDQYTFTHTELNGASKVAVRVTSNCNGTYYYSQYLWFSPLDGGKPRPSILVYDNGRNQVQYVATGYNILTREWAYIPPYRGTVIAGCYTCESITIQWQSTQLRIGVSLDVTSACGTANTVAY